MKMCSIMLLRLSLIVLVITLFLNFGSCFAVTFEEVDNYINLTANNYNGNSYYQQIKSVFNNKTDLRNKINQICNNYDSFYAKYDPGSKYYNFVFYTGTTGKITSENNQYKINGGGIKREITMYYTSNNATLGTQATFNSLALQQCVAFPGQSSYNTYDTLLCMNYSYYEITGTQGTIYVGMDAIPRYTYLEFNNSFIDNTTHNGNLFTYYYQGDFYSNNRIQIGTIIPNDSYYYEIYLKENSSNIIKGTIFCNVADLNIYNGDGALFLDDNQNLYVTTRLLNYSTQYKLEITSYYGDGGDNLSEDIDWIIFLPQNATFSGDYILSFGSGDFTEQDNANQIIDNVVSNINDMSNVSSEIDTFISGDLAGTLGFTEYDSSGDIWRATIINFTDQVADALMFSGDPYYDISLHGETPVRIYASSFTTPETPLKVFVRLALIFGCLYAIYFQLFTVFNMLTCGAPDEVIGNLAPDIYLYRM